MVVRLFESVDIKHKGVRFANTDETAASVLYQFRAGCSLALPAVPHLHPLQKAGRWIGPQPLVQ